MHAVAPKSQSAQVPVAGPAAVPVAHAESEAHHPQPLWAVHAPHTVSPAQGSGPTHSDRSQDHAPQLPVSGPVEDPSEQAPVSPHQPHGKFEVHASQPPWVPQVLPPHSLESQLQSPQDPAPGPEPVPVWHDPEPSPHQPQLPREVQSAQSVASEQASPPPHWLDNHDQVPQLPVEGPVDEPVVQPVPSHQPQG